MPPRKNHNVPTRYTQHNNGEPLQSPTRDREVAPPRQTTLESYVERLGLTNEHHFDNASRLDRIMQRLVIQPNDDAKVAPPSPPCSALGRLDDLLHGNTNAAQRITDIISKLEELI